MNKKQIIKAFLIGLIITAINTITGIPKSEGANWEFFAYHSVDEVTKYYDKESIVNPSGDIIRVWVKGEYEKEDEKFKDYDLTLIEINCNLREYRFLKQITYLKEPWSSSKDDPKKNYYESITSPSEWEALLPVEDSMLSILFNTICQNKL